MSELHEIAELLSCALRVNALLYIGAKKEVSVSDLFKTLDVAQPTMSHHLTLLKNGGLVKREQVHKRAFYSLNPQRTAFRLEDASGSVRNVLTIYTEDMTSSIEISVPLKHEVDHASKSF